MSGWQTSVSRVDGGKVLIRGYDLESLIGGQSFTSSCFLLIRGRMPSPAEERALDAVLNAILDYALLKPGTVAARYAVSANPNMVAGLATAVLSVGSYTLAPEDTARFALALAHKDFGLAADLARAHNVPTRLLDLCQQELQEAMNRGWGDADRLKASPLQEERAGVRLRT